MDIISEILETDRLAEEQLEQAMQKRSDMLEECRSKAERLIADAKAQAEEYRSALGENDGAGSAEELKVQEKAQLEELAKVYEKNHSAWEDEIVSAIIG